MCGRFALYHSTEEVADLFAVDHVAAGLIPRYNIAPGQPASVVVQHEHRTLEAFRWGLVPFWAKDSRIGNRLINARAETVAHKPAFRAAFRRRRCLVPASGFYEWRQAGKGKEPVYVHASQDRPLALAGLWEEWHSPDDELLHSCAIVTTAADEAMAPIHHRMPAVLDLPEVERWLSCEADPRELEALLLACTSAALASYPVSRQVNAPQVDTPECIQPLPQLDL